MKSLFKKLNWVQWIDILLLVLLTVFFAYLFWVFGSLYKECKQTFELYYPDSSYYKYRVTTYGKYLSFSIVAYVILVAFDALFFIREFKKNKEKV